RPEPGLVTGGGVYGCWPEIFGSLDPMARPVKDLATLLDVMAGYDPEDPITARGVGHIPDTFTKFLNKNGLQGARLGILRESIGLNAEPDSEDFKKVSEVFDRAVDELRAAGAEIVDPIMIPQIKELRPKRWGGPGKTDEPFKNYYGRSEKPPFKTPAEVIASPDFAKVIKRSHDRFMRKPEAAKHYESLRAQDE